MPRELSKAVIRRAPLLIIGVALMFVALGVASADVPMNKGTDNVAIGGYDTVAYFTEGKASKGKPEFAFVWRDARWLFSSQEHRDRFAATPGRYAPQFGGHCAGAMTRGVVVKADPEAWTIVDGKLYMKVNTAARDRWREKPEEKIAKGDEAWSKMTDQE